MILCDANSSNTNQLLCEKYAKIIIMIAYPQFYLEKKYQNYFTHHIVFRRKKFIIPLTNVLCRLQYSKSYK